MKNNIKNFTRKIVNALGKLHNSIIKNLLYFQRWHRSYKMESKNRYKICLSVNQSIQEINWLSISLEGSPDIYDDAEQLVLVPKKSCEKIIASHILEHMNYQGRGEERIRKTISVLRVWKSKIISGGRLYISVPYMDKILEIITKNSKRYWNMKNTKYIDLIGPVYGGMNNKFNRHSMIYNYNSLNHCLRKAGFKNIKISNNIDNFLPEYNPSSKRKLSLNVSAIKP